MTKNSANPFLLQTKQLYVHNHIYQFYSDDFIPPNCTSYFHKPLVGASRWISRIDRFEMNEMAYLINS